MRGILFKETLQRYAALVYYIIYKYIYFVFTEILYNNIV